MMPKILAVAIFSWLMAISPIQRATFYGQNKSSAVTFNPCLISAWPMNEGSGLTLNDVSGNGNTATINTGASVTWTANSIKSGVASPNWNGTGYALTTNTTIANFSGSTPFSVSTWEFSNVDANQSSLGTLATGSNFLGWELGISFHNGGVYTVQFFLINNASTPNWIAVNSSGTFLPFGMHYIVATYDGTGFTHPTGAGVIIYIDGSPVTTTVTANTLSTSAASGLPVRFGARNDGTDEFSGPMAYSEIYNCVLTPTQISTYNASGPGIY